MRPIPPAIALWFAIVACVTSPAASLRAAEPDPKKDAFFEQQIRPLLLGSCARCHGPKKQESGLRVDVQAGLMKGGDSGPALVPGKPDQSLLLKAVRHQGDVHMPPDKKLPAEQINALSRWIEMGAPWPSEGKGVSIRSGEITAEDRKFWSLQPVRKPPLPAVRDAGWPQSTVDRFILAALEARGLAPVAAADKQTLLRRATFDLTGLPPTPAELETFLGDTSPDAFAKVIDRLLASPAYGERWGRHWLDVVRYADTAGETADYPVREAYRYRNYVIDSFNHDKPYDQFVREQIAGDILAQSAPREQYAELVTATGYLALSRRFGFDPQNYQHLTIQDTIDTLGQSVLGLSLGCARCHHHKFDPVSIADYYALYGIFASTSYSFPGSEEKSRPQGFAPLIPPADAALQQKARTEELNRLASEIKAVDAKRSAAEAALKVLPQGPPRPADVGDCASAAELQAKLARLAAQRAEAAKRQGTLAANPPFAVAYGVSEGKVQNARIHKRGEPTAPGDEVPRRFLTVLGGDPLPADAGSGRLQLAHWLTDPRNPLTARVMVNRVWQHHFGNGLVATENDVGARGQRPTHPELLDYLAADFVASGWSIKSLHRTIMLSRTYQLASASDGANERLDPDNRMLWRHSRRRLDAESIRDAMLFVGGRLDRAEAGPHPFPPVEAWSFTQHRPFLAVYETNQRSVYLMTQRIKRHPFLALFDGPDTNATTPKRLDTTVPTQALFLMNDPFVHEQSAGLAQRLLAAPDEPARVRLAFRMALAREPKEEETQQALTFLESYRKQLEAVTVPADKQPVRAWAAYCRTLLTRNEFLFID
jgi:cytochrome c553